MYTLDLRYNPVNEIVKYKFLQQLEHSKEGKDPDTVRQYANAIHEFEAVNNFKNFIYFTSDWALRFKHHLNDKRNQHTGEHISKSYLLHYVSHVRALFEWLKVNVKEFAKLKQSDIDYLYVRKKEKSQARATNPQESHKVEDILRMIRMMPAETEIEMRDKALLSLFILTTPRIASIQEARIGRVVFKEEYDAWAFLQDPRLQNTKGSPFITSFFIGQVQDVIDNVVNWKGYLESKGRKDKAYLFPKITPFFTKEGEQIMVLGTDYIKSPSQIREIVKRAYEAAGLKYIKPHNFRHSISRHVRKSKQEVTDTMIALAENAGQKNGYSTLITSYAGDPLEGRARLMKSIELE